MPVYKYVGFMLTPQQAATIASSIAKKDLTDLSKTMYIAKMVGVLTSALMKRFPQCELWPTSCPRGSSKEEDARVLIVCHAYDHPHETRQNYTKIPATQRDVKMLAWLKRNGMDVHDMLRQWVTIPDPQDDDPQYVLIRDDDDY